MKISPSMLASDFSNLENEIKKIQNADMVHMDVMDGNFVPNISFGADVIKSLRNKSTLPFDVHLMINNPLEYIDSFADAEADIITFHAESNSDIEKTIEKIKSKNIKVGISIKPKTPAKVLFPYLKYIDVVLIMTVEPGFGGQKFMPEQIQKSLILRNHSPNEKFLIEADGGINFETINIVKKYPVDICVSGTCIFNSPNPCGAIEKLK